MIGGVLVEKDLETVKQDLETQVANVKFKIKFLNFKRLNKLWKWSIKH